MSAAQINSKIQFMDEEKRVICKRLIEIMEKDDKSFERIKGCLDDVGITFIQELPIESLKFILKLEESCENGTIGDVLIQEGIRHGFIQYTSDMTLQ